MDNAFFNTKIDPELLSILEKERHRQQSHIDLIASENCASPAVLKLTGSVFTNKYCEGYPGRRYYAGCDVIDKAETLAIKRASALFNCHCDRKDCKQAYQHVNVQPHAGSQANAEVMGALLKPGAKILGMSLAAGGHLTHGHHVSFSGQIYQAISYGVRASDGVIDYDEVERLALEHKPGLIIAGASAYSLIIDWKRFRAIADKCKAYLLADVAHIAGLIVAGIHPNPVCDADVITTTTHKTLRGPRGAIILCRADLGKKIDRAVFPGYQGGPLEHVILAKAQAFAEAQTESFKIYQQQIVLNAQTMARIFKNHGLKVIANGTDNHLLMVDTYNSFLKLTGYDAAERLAKVGIIANKNMIPFDKLSPQKASGVRFGTPLATTRGFKEGDFKILTHLILQIWQEPEANFDQKIYLYKNQVAALLKNKYFYKF